MRTQRQILFNMLLQWDFAPVEEKPAANGIVENPENPIASGIAENPEKPTASGIAEDPNAVKLYVQM